MKLTYRQTLHKILVPMASSLWLAQWQAYDFDNAVDDTHIVALQYALITNVETVASIYGKPIASIIDDLNKETAVFEELPWIKIEWWNNEA